MTIPVIISRADTASPPMSAGLLRNRIFSHPMPRAIEMIGSAAGDYRLDRRQERALLEGVLVEQEAGRADDGKDIDGPVAEHSRKPAADVHELG